MAGNGGGHGVIVFRTPLAPGDAARLARALAEGEVMAYPTETFYALGGNALSQSLVERIFRLKGRPGGKAVPLLINPLAGGAGYADLHHPWAQRLTAAFWPGALTLVVPAGPALPAHLAGPGGTVAVRWSPHPVVAALWRLGGVPLIGTSANRGGAPPANSAGEVMRDFGAAGALVIAGGGPAGDRTPGGAPSTLVDLTTSPPRLLRAGAIPTAALRRVLGKILLAEGP